MLPLVALIALLSVSTAAAAAALRVPVGPETSYQNALMTWQATLALSPPAPLPPSPDPSPTALSGINAAVDSSRRCLVRRPTRWETLHISHSLWLF